MLKALTAALIIDEYHTERACQYTNEVDATNKTEDQTPPEPCDRAKEDEKH